MIPVAVALGGGYVVAVGGYGYYKAVKATCEYFGAREQMKMGDVEIEKERQKEREEEATQDKLRQPEKQLHHFTHKYSLAEVNSESYRGNCNVCDQPITRGWAYRCYGCDYYIHQVCAKELVALSPCSYARVKEIKSPADQTTISTFAHKEHRVKDVYSNIDYECHHCYTAGYGKRFQCEDCNVNLHPVCATCPTKISTFMHPQHDLELKTRRHFSICSICNEKEKSNIRMYRCKACEFYVHPACNQLPQHLMHDLHPPHPLQLRPAARSRRCDANCNSDCESGKWCYECKICNVSIHIKCILQHSAGRTSNKKEIEEILQLLTCAQKFVEVSGGIIDIAINCHVV